MNKKGISTGMVVFLIIGLVIGVTAFGIANGYINLGLQTISAGNYKLNYQWFKDQESAMVQVKNQICAGQDQIVEFKQTFGNITQNWTSDTVKQYGDLTFARNGYISKYNSLVADYNAHRSDWIRDFGKGSAPEEYVEFYQTQCKGGI